LYNYYNSNKGLLEERYKEENKEVTRAASSRNAIRKKIRK